MVTFNAKLGVWLQEGISFALTRYLLVFVQGAREGLDIEARYHALSRKSRRDLAKLNLTRGQIAQAALKGIPADASNRLSLRESADADSASPTFVSSSRRPPTCESSGRHGSRTFEKASIAATPPL